MTEIEARSKIKYRIANEMRKAGENKEEYEDLEIALQVMKEIREYRELGTVEELQELKEKNVIPIATIKFNKEDMQEIVDEKIKEFELDIKEIRNKAIDEFVSILSIRISEVFIWDMLITMNKNSSLSDTSDEIVEYVIETSKKIAKKMKGGATDESTGSD